VEFSSSDVSRLIKAPQVVDFLRRLLAQLPGKLLIVWDGLPAHRSKLVKEFTGKQRGRIWLERLPAYAPELNPMDFPTALVCQGGWLTKVRMFTKCPQFS
jgi:hypothetical protein